MADDSIEKVLERMNTKMSVQYYILKKYQKEAIINCKSKDVLAVLPTGYGKTVIIQALPFLNEEGGCVIVVNALNGIIQEQQTRFGDKCIVITEEIINLLENNSSTDINTVKTLSRLTDGDDSLHYILCHPEMIVHPSMKRVLLSQPLCSRITHIVIDEAHCVLSWGNSDFRPAYLKLGLLRAIVNDAKILGLTATATKKAQEQISNSLHMIGPVIISESPDRSNVFLEVKRRLPSTGGDNTAEMSMFNTVDPILKKLAQEGRNFEKTVVYVPLKWCGLLHHRACTQFLADDQLDLVAQYHAPQSQQMKTLIVKTMQDAAGSIKLLFATEAYGMGIDVKDIRNVIHIGPPSNLETFIQEIGRCGRDGKEAKATMYYNNTDIASNLLHLQDEMRKYVTVTTCRRNYLLQYFGFVNANIDPHKCCDNCLTNCTCTCCKANGNQETTTCTKFPNQKADTAKHLLKKYFDAENAVVDALVPSLLTGLSDSLAKSIATEQEYSNPEKLAFDYPMLKQHYIENISEIISSVKHMKI